MALDNHLATQHGIYCLKAIDREPLMEREPQTYTAYQSANGSYICPALNCAGTATTKWSLRRHFRLQHPLDIISIVGGGTYPRYQRCRHQVSMLANGHEQFQNCQEGYERQMQHEAAARASRALDCGWVFIPSQAF